MFCIIVNIEFEWRPYTGYIMTKLLVSDDNVLNFCRMTHTINRHSAPCGICKAVLHVHQSQAGLIIKHSTLASSYRLQFSNIVQT